MQRWSIVKRSIMSLCWCYFRRGHNYWHVAEFELDDPSNINSIDLPNHNTGYLSMACIQSNFTMEDSSSVEIRPLGTFVGIYDGHGGPDAARYVCNHLYTHLIGLPFGSGKFMCKFVEFEKILEAELHLDEMDNAQMNHVLLCGFPGYEEITRRQEDISEEVLKSAFHTMEEDFMQHAFTLQSSQPDLLSVGSCCLVGFICAGILYVANLGDSRAVLGRSSHREGRGFVAVQLTSDHNAREDIVRRQLRAMHPGDHTIVEKVKGVWRVKSIIQVSRSIGDAYLKRPPEVDRRLLAPRYVTKEILTKAVLTAVPEISTRQIGSGDKFVIFASDGLWDNLTNQEAVDIVHTNIREGIAKRLIKAALYVACKKNKGMEYSKLLELNAGEDRRRIYDDISVVVVFFDYHPLNIVDPISLRDGALIESSSSHSVFSTGENVASTGSNIASTSENITSIQ